MKPHECKPDGTCRCYILGLEPNEDCPVHGHPWPPRCGECGRLLPWPKIEEVSEGHTQDSKNVQPKERKSKESSSSEVAD